MKEDANQRRKLSIPSRRICGRKIRDGTVFPFIYSSQIWIFGIFVTSFLFLVIEWPSIIAFYYWLFLLHKLQFKMKGMQTKGVSFQFLLGESRGRKIRDGIVFPFIYFIFRKAPNWSDSSFGASRSSRRLSYKPLQRGIQPKPYRLKKSAAIGRIPYPI